MTSSATTMPMNISHIQTGFVSQSAKRNVEIKSMSVSLQ